MEPQQYTTLKRIVVAIDPSVSSNSTSDETGIIVAGRGEDGFGYILSDLSGIMPASEWAKVAIEAYYAYAADRIIAEINQGGDLVQQVIRSVDPRVSFKSVRATRGKAVRAEPIVSLYEQGKVFHTHAMEKLEDQLCNWDPIHSKKSPDRLDALVWALTDLMLDSDPPAQIW